MSALMQSTNGKPIIPMKKVIAQATHALRHGAFVPDPFPPPKSQPAKTLADDVLKAEQIPCKFPANGCKTEYKAYVVLRKENIDGNLHILRVLTIKDGVIIKQEDNIEDLAGVQIGKAMIELEQVLG